MSRHPVQGPDHGKAHQSPSSGLGGAAGGRASLILLRLVIGGGSACTRVEEACASVRMG